MYIKIYNRYIKPTDNFDFVFGLLVFDMDSEDGSHYMSYVIYKHNKNDNMTPSHH